MYATQSHKTSTDTNTNTTLQVENLLTLKQQQASVVQAYQAIKQGRTTVIQGKNIMAFTILTIIFVCSATYLKANHCTNVISSYQCHSSPVSSG